MRSEQVINASQLAYIAAKPDVYVAKKGKAWNPAGAKSGQAFHDTFGGKHGWINGILMWTLLAAFLAGIFSLFL
jgi:hypothetical protein